MLMDKIALRRTPLWAAAHLPLKGGDHAVSATRLISPLEGEMSGRTEGGAPGHKSLRRGAI